MSTIFGVERGKRLAILTLAEARLEGWRVPEAAQYDHNRRMRLGAGFDHRHGRAGRPRRQTLGCFRRQRIGIVLQCDSLRERWRNWQNPDEAGCGKDKSAKRMHEGPVLQKVRDT